MIGSTAHIVVACDRCGHAIRVYGSRAFAVQCWQDDGGVIGHDDGHALCGSCLPEPPDAERA